MPDTYLPADVMNRASWFTHDRFGMFIHWGVYAIPAMGEWALRNQWIPYETYRRYAQRFNPVHFNANEWAQLAQDAGMRYFIFTTKHHDGFCMFDNPHTDWKVTNTPCGRDVTRALAQAYRARGLKVGFYHSLIDWMHPEYEICDTHPLWVDSAAKARPRDHAKYADYLHKSVEHILTQYGQVDLLWVDYTPHMKTPEHWRADELMALIRRLQPNVLIDDRLDSHERGNPNSRFPGDYYSPEQIIPASPPTMGGHRRVWEALVTMNDNWGYHAGDQNFKPARSLIHTLVRCVANDGNLLLNVGPDAMGRIPDPSVVRLREMGAWLRQYGQTVYGAGAARELTAPPGCVYTRNGQRLFLHVLDWPHMPIRLPGLQGKVQSATLLKDGSNIPLASANATDEDASLCLGFHEPDGLDSVVELHMEEQGPNLRSLRGIQ